MHPARSMVMIAVLTAASAASADPLRVVVRDGGSGDDLVLERLAGQISDLEVETVTHDGKLEKNLDRQIAAAAKLATSENATAVVWFRKDDDALVVVVATPGDRRVFVRTIDAGDASATAEAAAQAARSALRAISLGGTIGVEMPAPEPEPKPDEAPPPPPPKAREHTHWNAGVGWLFDYDRGADVGAHALWQRLGISRGHWGGALSLSLGPPLAKDGEVAVELSRSAALLSLEFRAGGFRAALGAGVAVYHRTTVEVPEGLLATDSAVQAAFDAAPEVRWVFHPHGWGVELAVGCDVVYRAPELQVDRGGGMVETLSKVATFQPRISVGVVVGP